ncbi:MAG: MNIO family bufferin maturase [Polaromonas sp.]|uniref:MNIO family bufferin maturase n=1 Tax=Polaromonas sp. TaxID=1869339 RepID=UPI00403511FC
MLTPKHFAASAPVGIGWRHPHCAELLETRPALDFLEVHSENFFADGGAALALLRQARESYPVSLHGVGLALGSACGVDRWHLDQLARLAERIEPLRISDHACFARAVINGRDLHAGDLLPIPFNQESLDLFCRNVQQVQERLQRPLLVENLSAYLTLAGSDRSETDFLGELAQRTGCGLLVDVNNIYVNALNARIADGQDAPDPLRACEHWLDQLPAAAVGEIHLAGHCVMEDIVIDDHGSGVGDAVWQLYAHAIARFGAVPTLVEWDTALPPLAVLLGEAECARLLNQPVQVPA